MLADTIQSGTDFLDHVGVKGMKWGQRKSDLSGQGVPGPHPGVPAKTSNANKEWRKKVITSENVTKMLVEGEPAYRRELKKINAKYGNKITPKNEKAYNSEVYAATLNSMDAAARKVFGTSPDGKYRMTASVNPKGNIISVRPVPVDANMRVEAVLKQMSVGADPGNFTINIEMVKGDDGLFTGELKFLNVRGGAIEQSSFESGSEFLEHYGVKGMKWGVRRTPEQLARAEVRRDAARERREARRDERQTARLERKKIKAVGDANNKIEKTKAKAEVEKARAIREAEAKAFAARVQAQQSIQVQQNQAPKNQNNQQQNQGPKPPPPQQSATGQKKLSPETKKMIRGAAGKVIEPAVVAAGSYALYKLIGKKFPKVASSAFPSMVDPPKK